MPASAGPALLPGDIGIRHDIQLLADSGLITGPVTTWPMSWPDIGAQLRRTENDEERLEPAVVAALERIRFRLREASAPGLTPIRAQVAVAEAPTPLRTFAAAPREEGEVGATLEWLGDRLSANLSVTAVSDADDDRSLRADGSYVGAHIGNASIFAGWMDRWWGPGYEGSLILSNNARPIPALTIERTHSKPWRSPLLRWLGPWRATASFGQLEGSDVAVPDARLFAARLNFRPLTWLEIGLSRSAQWCGAGRPCDLSTFGDLLLGRDNRSDSLGIEREPGNQLAGYDVRLRSPWRPLPAALYLQLIGEDEAGGLPSKFLGLLGLESWGQVPWGSYRVHAEYADTSCNFSREQPQFGCAYRHELYPQGYRYRGRDIGHSIGGDGRTLAFGAMLATAGGATLSLLARRVELGRPERQELKNLELQYNRRFARGELGVGAGLDDFEGAGDASPELRGFLQWRQGF